MGFFGRDYISPFNSNCTGYNGPAKSAEEADLSYFRALGNGIRHDSLTGRTGTAEELAKKCRDERGDLEALLKRIT